MDRREIITSPVEQFAPPSNRCPRAALLARRSVGAHVFGMTDAAQRYRTFRDFYPFYLTEHVSRTSRRLHVVGTSLAIACLLAAILVDWRFALAAPIMGYGFAWTGHFFFEKNRPATFQYPLFSLMGDLRLFGETVMGRRRW
jgi:hypothetical protein